MMDGRWILFKWGSHTRVEGPDTETVPVVPCDDAAIERVAIVLERWYGDSPDRQHIAAELLRAAGDAS